ncbi:TPA: hypothetical protein NHK69_003055 [Pseudomonas aeruginosa]|nr:hypothetical protein [Pseudomonas aeruginosa]
MPSDTEVVPVQKPDAASAKLKQAVRNIVAAKDALDAALRLPASTFLVPPELPNAAGSAVDVSAFTRTIVPFLDFRQSVGSARTHVPLDRLLGESWRWREAPSATGLADYLLQDERSAPGDRDQAIVFEIAPLGLWFAHEGKNRVHFLRSGGAIEMPAMVTTIDYPAASRLALYRLAVAGREEMWCVLDGRQAKRLLLPKVTHTLLTAYGVTPASTWPKNLPSPRTITDALQQQERHAGNGPDIDLDVLRGRIAEKASEETFTEVSLLDALAGGLLRTRWRWIASASAILLSVLALSMALPQPWGSEIRFLATGVIGGFVAILMFPWMQVRRKHLRRDDL